MNDKIEDIAEEAWGRAMETMGDDVYIPIEAFAEAIINLCIEQSDSVSCRARIREIFGLKVVNE